MSKLPDDPALVVDAIVALAKRSGLGYLIPILAIAEAEYEHVEQDWGIDYYRIVLSVPFELYSSLESLEQSESDLAELAAKATRACSDGKVTSASLAPAFDAPSDWRGGARPTVVSVSEADRIWKVGHFRLFLSHLAADKVRVGDLKAKLELRNVDAFVAHEDIEPSFEWQKEIELALSSCHAIAALITPGFQNSIWCLQEVGWGLGRGVLVQPIKLPDDPKGFVGSLQAFPGSLDDPTSIRDRLVNVFAKNPRTRRQMHEPLVTRLESASSARQALFTLESLDVTDGISEDHARRILKATETNVFVKQDSSAKSLATKIANKFLPQTNVAPPPDEYDPFADE